MNINMFDMDNVCNCNCVCEQDANGRYMCHLKAPLYEPVLGLGAFCDENQSSWSGQSPDDVKAQVVAKFPRAFVSVITEGSKVPSIKVVSGRRCIIRVDTNGKVVSVGPMK